ncbi:MAG: hypothetical protein D6815_06605 [Candidatus Dadabacteria bacterium]|nr:MAG: hypothetical protein D6815_06605 [Candidatus Dadabacteria bacterium]
MKRDDEKVWEKTPEDAPALAEHDEAALDLRNPDAEQMRRLATAPALQALWSALLPLVGVLPSRPGEYPGVFKIERGPEKGEATIFIDIPNEEYEPGKPPRMERVVALSVRMAHDYRLLGGRYYCVDCEIPAHETRH